MNLLKTTARCAIALAVLTAPTLASAQNGYYDSGGRYHRTHHRTYARNDYGRNDYGRRTCGAQKRAHGNNGTAIGAVSGGVLGSALGGGKFGNVLLGAGAGAVAGHAIGRNTVRC